VDVEEVLTSLADIAGKKQNEGTNTTDAGDSPPQSESGDDAPSVPAAHAPSKSDEQSAATRPEESIRVATEKLDCLANTVGEIVISRVKLAGNVNVLRHVAEVMRSQNKVIGEIGDQLKTRARRDEDSVSDDLAPALNKFKESNNDLAELVVAACGEQHDAMCRIEAIIDQLDSDVTALRMRPVSTVFELFPRIVRDLAEEYGKEVDLEIHGGETELDRSMLEGIKDPLMHLVRNATDHGVETREEREEIGKPACGKIKLSAEQDGDRVLITLEDDGRGMDVDQIRASAVKQRIVTEKTAWRLSDDEVRKLVFRPGFSTKTTVTNVSGRGVGTDVVKKYVEDNLHGQVRLQSVVNNGTRFTLVLPLTLAVTPSVLVRAEGQLFAIPAHAVQLGMSVEETGLKSIDGKLAVNVIDTMVPLVKLADTLSLPASRSNTRDSCGGPAKSDQLEVVVVEHDRRRLAFVIDELVEEQDIVVKRLDPPLDDLPFVAGVTILEKGEVVPILQVHKLIKSGQRAGAFRGEESGNLTATKEEPRRNVLVVEDSLTTRELMKNIIKSAGYNVDDASDGVEALNKIADNDPDLIVTDIEMPRMDGFEMTERIKKDPDLQDIPVIIVTSMFLDEDRKRGLEVGADAYIRKGDFDQSKLIDTIKRLVV
jgi:two-component system chemotaxis sensor kinase CheA